MQIPRRLAPEMAYEIARVLERSHECPYVIQLLPKIERAVAETQAHDMPVQGE